MPSISEFYFKVKWSVSSKLLLKQASVGSYRKMTTTNHHIRHQFYYAHLTSFLMLCSNDTQIVYLYSHVSLLTGRICSEHEQPYTMPTYTYKWYTSLLWMGLYKRLYQLCLLSLMNLSVNPFSFALPAQKQMPFFCTKLLCPTTCGN